MNRQLRLSLCQYQINFLDWEPNASTAKEYVNQAALSGSDLILFPEMSLTGISPVEAAPMTDYDGRNLKLFKELAIKHQIGIGFGWGKPVISDDPNTNKLENHYTVIDPAGNILSDYVKIHPFTYGGEDKFFVRGNSFSSFDYCGFRIATFICYDMRFPELFQAASKDCDLITVAANWPAPRRMHWNILSQARAIENQVYFAVCNCVGQVGALNYSGDSSIYGPDGTLLTRLTNQEGLVTCTLENNVKDIRAAFPVKQDRMVDYYKTIL